MATIESIRDQLAFMGEFGNRASGTHVDTRIAMHRYEIMESPSVEDVLSGRPYRLYNLNEDGEALARQSPLFYCFKWLRENGYRFLEPRGGRHTQKGNFIQYASVETDENDRPLRTAYISGWSRVYVNHHIPGKPGAVCEFDGRQAASEHRKAIRELAGVRPAGVR